MKIPNSNHAVVALLGASEGSTAGPRKDEDVGEAEVAEEGPPGSSLREGVAAVSPAHAASTPSEVAQFRSLSKRRRRAKAGANNLIDLTSLPEQEIDYIALGDWHNLKQVSDRAWYPGTPEPDRFDQGDDNQRGQVLAVHVSRSAAPEVQTIPTGRIRWHNIRCRFNSDEDLDRFERQVDELTAGRVARDLLRVEVSGSLSLAGHRRYDQIVGDLENRLLRLRLKGECQQAPEATELEQLTGRMEDPLIARVAEQRQGRLQREDDPDSEQAALARTALCELFRFTTV